MRRYLRWERDVLAVAGRTWFYGVREYVWIEVGVAIAGGIATLFAANGDPLAAIVGGLATAGALAFLIGVCSVATAPYRFYKERHLLAEQRADSLPRVYIERTEPEHHWLDNPSEGSQLVKRHRSDYCAWLISRFRIVNRGTRNIDLTFTLLAREASGRAVYESANPRRPEGIGTIGQWWPRLVYDKPHDDYLKPGTDVNIAPGRQCGPITLAFIMLISEGQWHKADVFLRIHDIVSGETLPDIPMDSSAPIEVDMSTNPPPRRITSPHMYGGQV
jgi:hypothetical protein